MVSRSNIEASVGQHKYFAANVNEKRRDTWPFSVECGTANHWIPIHNVNIPDFATVKITVEKLERRVLD